MKPPLIKAKGITFVSTLKERNQITVDSSVVELLKLEKGNKYLFMVVKQ